MVSLGFMESTSIDMQKKRRGGPPGSKNRPKGICTEEYIDHEAEGYIATVGHNFDDNEPPSKKRRGRPPGSRNRFSVYPQSYGEPVVSDNRNIISEFGDIKPSMLLQKELQESGNSTEEIYEGVPSMVPPIQVHQLPSESSGTATIVLPRELPKPGTLGVSRFSERVVASLSRYLGTKGGDLRLGCDEHGMEVFIVRCLYCARDVRLSGRRTWNFTGVHIPRCIKHGFRKADDVSSAPAPPGRPPTGTLRSFSGLPNKVPLSLSSVSCAPSHQHAYGMRNCSVDDAAAREARLAVVAAAAAAGVFPGLKHGVPPTVPQAAAAAAALMNLQHTSAGAALGIGADAHSHIFLPPSSVMGSNSSAFVSVPLGMSSALPCLQSLGNSVDHQVLPFSSEHMSHFQQPASLAYQQHNNTLIGCESTTVHSAMWPYMDSAAVSLQHAQFNVVPEFEDSGLKKEDCSSGVLRPGDDLDTLRGSTEQTAGAIPICYFTQSNVSD